MRYLTELYAAAAKMHGRLGDPTLDGLFDENILYEGSSIVNVY